MYISWNQLTNLTNKLTLIDRGNNYTWVSDGGVWKLYKNGYLDFQTFHKRGLYVEIKERIKELNNATT
jgi:hypothetical protein